MSAVGANTVAVLVERHGEHIARPTLEALTLARSLGTPVAVWLGGAPSEEAVEVLGDYGAAQVRVISDDVRLASVGAAALRAASEDAEIVLVVSTFVNKEIATRLAYATGAGVVVDVAGAEVVDGHVETFQTVFAATWNVRTRVNRDLAIVGVRPNTTLAVAYRGRRAARRRRGAIRGPGHARNCCARGSRCSVGRGAACRGAGGGVWRAWDGRRLRACARAR